MLDDIERARRPQYAYIRGVADRRLVADLDRVMTMEKSVLADWKRVPGCETDLQQRRLVEALNASGRVSPSRTISLNWPRNYKSESITNTAEPVSKATRCAPCARYGGSGTVLGHRRGRADVLFHQGFGSSKFRGPKLAGSTAKMACLGSQEGPLHICQRHSRHIRRPYGPGLPRERSAGSGPSIVSG